MSSGQPHKKTLKADLIFIAALLILSAAAFILYRVNLNGGAYVIVTVDSAEVGRYSLDEDGTYILNGGTNTLVISDGTARIIDARCPDKLCVNQGSIRYTGQSIVCLPNRLIVTVYGGEESPVDFVS